MPAEGESLIMEKIVLRWGGLAGMLGGIIFIFSIVVLVGLAPPPATTTALVMSYPDHRAAITLGDALYVAAVILWVPLFLALFRALRGTSLAPGLFGSGLAIMGLVSDSVGALPPVAFSRISDLYHAPGATPVDQATLVLLWQATQGIFNETDTMGFVFMNLGIIVLGLAMLKAPSFGKIFGGVSVVLGVAGVLGISLFAVDSVSFAPFAILAFMVFPLLFGWKVYSLSKNA